MTTATPPEPRKTGATSAESTAAIESAAPSAAPQRGRLPTDTYFNRELSWLGFARRVLAQVEDASLPLLERVKFAGIVGMLHDEFFMKRISGLKARLHKGRTKPTFDGFTPDEAMRACREELSEQIGVLTRQVRDEIRPALKREGIPILDYAELTPEQQATAREYFRESVLPILTPLAVDAAHPFPFISNLGLNLAVNLAPDGKKKRFIRVKVPGNRPRWIAVGGGAYTPLEQVIARNLDLLFAKVSHEDIYFFRVTRGAKGESTQLALEDRPDEPGSIIKVVTDELKARRFAGVVRVQVDARMPRKLVKWLGKQLAIRPEELEETRSLLGASDLLHFRVPDRPDLRHPARPPVTHPRLLGLNPRDSGAIFRRIAEGDIFVHHPYDSFDTSVFRFLESATRDPDVLAIKLTIYRTSTDSPIVHALVEAARLGKQVAVLVEITARFDEAPNIAWGRYLEAEGVHVAYGVEKLKTHVKASLVVREENGKVRRYAHFGTGNYHSGTARLYEDIGVLTCDPDICSDVAAVFNELTGAAPYYQYKKLLVAPRAMRQRFTALIRREADNAAAGKRAGIEAKMNQLQDPDVISELYRASQAGVPIRLHIRGLCCLRPGVPGLSENIAVQGVIGRFLEHSRIYRFENDGDPEFFIGSADWMRRNLDRRVETVAPILDDAVKRELEKILQVYKDDNSSAWDCQPDGTYVRRNPTGAEKRRGVQAVFLDRASRRERRRDSDND